MSNKTNNNNGDGVLGCLGGCAGSILSLPFSILAAGKIINYYIECDPPDSDCNGIVAFTRAINNGVLTFIVVTIVGAILGAVIVWFIFKQIDRHI